MVAIVSPSRRTVPDFRVFRDRWAEVVGFEDDGPGTAYVPRLPERVVRWFCAALGVGQKADLARMREELELLSHGAEWRHAYRLSWFLLEMTLFYSEGGRDMAGLHRRLDRMIAGWDGRWTAKTEAPAANEGGRDCTHNETPPTKGDVP